MAANWLYRDSELGAHTRGPWDLKNEAPTPLPRGIDGLLEPYGRIMVYMTFVLSNWKTKTDH